MKNEINVSSQSTWNLVNWPFLRAIFHDIARYLTNSDLLRLQQTCKTFIPIVDDIFSKKYNIMCRQRLHLFNHFHTSNQAVDLRSSLSEDELDDSFLQVPSSLNPRFSPSSNSPFAFGVEVEEWKKVNPSINSKLVYYLARDKADLSLIVSSSIQTKTMNIIPPSSLPRYHPYSNRDYYNLYNWWACIQTLYIAPEWLFYYSLSSIHINKRGSKHISYDNKYHPLTKDMLMTMRHTLLYVHFTWFALTTCRDVDPIWGLLWKGTTRNIDVVLTFCFLAMWGFAQAMMMGLVMEQSSPFWLFQGMKGQSSVVTWLLLETTAVMIWTTGLIPLFVGAAYMLLLFVTWMFWKSIPDSREWKMVAAPIFVMILISPFFITSFFQVLFMWWTLALHILQILFVDNWHRVANVHLPPDSRPIRFDNRSAQGLLRGLLQLIIVTILIFFIMVFLSMTGKGGLLNP